MGGVSKENVSAECRRDRKSQITQPLCVTNKFDHVLAYGATFCHLAFPQLLHYLVMFSSSLLQIQSVQLFHHIKNGEVLITFLELCIHARKHQALYCGVVIQFTRVDILIVLRCILSGSGWESFLNIVL